MSEKNGPITDPGQVRYYKSFASYEIPFRPDGLIDYAEAEGLRSFYVAQHDAAGRVVRFDKIQLVRAAPAEREIELSIVAAPNSNVYFEAAHDDSGGVSATKQIEFRKTEHLDEYFAGVVDSSGRKCRPNLLRKETAFSDEYEYWANGSLRQRTMSCKGKPKTVAHYDREGVRVDNPLPDKIDPASSLIDNALSEQSV